MPLSDADEAYVRACFSSLDELSLAQGRKAGDVRRLIADELLPRPSYVLPDGTEMVPPSFLDELEEVDDPGQLPRRFCDQYLEAAQREGIRVDAAELEAEWQNHLTGLYGVCLRTPTPRNIVRKAVLATRIERLLDAPAPADDGWRGALRAATDELDALECGFSPDYDRRQRFDRPVSRERLVERPRASYLVGAVDSRS